MKINAILTVQTCILASCLVLSSCGSQQIKTQVPLDQQPELALTLDDANALINSARNKLEPMRSQDLVAAGKALFAFNALDRAKNTLLSADKSQLTAQQHVTYSLVLANINLQQGSPFKAKFHLWQPSFMQAVLAGDKETQISVYDKRATLLFDISEYEESVYERITLGSKLTAKDDIDMRMLNQDLLWQALMSMQTDRLLQLSQTNSSKTARGWYRLGALSKENQSNLEQQLKAVDLWRSAWPNHPASRILPADLQLLEQLVATQPQQIAVLLPLSGKLQNAAQTILDGFLAAHFNINSQNLIQPMIKVYDTHNVKIDNMYDLAVEEGAQFIIGPLDKENIAILAKRKQFPVPTLALNYIETPTNQTNEDNATFATGLNNEPFSFKQNALSLDTDADQPTQHINTAENKGRVKTPLYEIAQSNTQTPETLQQNNRHFLYQFGLALEDEATQVANKAFRDGHRRAMIIAPATTFGRRGSEQFTKDWVGMGGDIVQIAEFNSQKEYSQLVEAALGVKASKDRAQQLARVIGATDDFEPRRRQDIDMVFLLARPSQARQLKPILNFHYASDIPVYSTSHIYNGQENTGLNRDMNGVTFTSLPWFFGKQSQEKSDIIKHGAQQQGSAFYPLYAFGVDAYHLYPRLKQLKNIEQARFYGATGSLSVQSGQRIAREQTWAKFIGGRAQEISITSSDKSAL